MSVSRTGTTPTPFGFVGGSQYQTDNDSGLMLLGHRYYDPSTGRFLSQDPIQDGDNWYAYCENNPLGKTDPEGLQGASMAAKLARAAATVEVAGGGPEDPIADVVAGGLLIGSAAAGLWDWWQRTHTVPAAPVSTSPPGDHRAKNPGRPRPDPGKKLPKVPPPRFPMPPRPINPGGNGPFDPTGTPMPNLPPDWSKAERLAWAIAMALASGVDSK